jgi:hypothetical protein
MVPMQGPRGMQMVPMPGYRPSVNHQQQMAAMYANMQVPQRQMGHPAHMGHMAHLVNMGKDGFVVGRTP